MEASVTDKLSFEEAYERLRMLGAQMSPDAADLDKVFEQLQEAAPEAAELQAKAGKKEADPMEVEAKLNQLMATIFCWRAYFFGRDARWKETYAQLAHALERCNTPFQRGRVLYYLAFTGQALQDSADARKNIDSAIETLAGYKGSPLLEACKRLKQELEYDRDNRSWDNANHTQLMLGRAVFGPLLTSLS
jgi:exonuclease VII small subunit